MPATFCSFYRPFSSIAQDSVGGQWRREERRREEEEMKDGRHMEQGRRHGRSGAPWAGIFKVTIVIRTNAKLSILRGDLLKALEI